MGPDIHKRTVVFCVNEADRTIVNEGKLSATRQSPASWAESIDMPWADTKSHADTSPHL